MSASADSTGFEGSTRDSIFDPILFTFIRCNMRKIKSGKQSELCEGIQTAHRTLIFLCCGYPHDGLSAEKTARLLSIGDDINQERITIEEVDPETKMLINQLYYNETSKSKSLLKSMIAYNTSLFEERYADCFV